MIELFVKILDEVFSVELAEGVPIGLNKTFKDYKNITNTQIPKTLPIKIPNTDKNKEIFFGFQNIALIGGANYQSQILATLYLDGQKLIAGQLQVQSFTEDAETIDVVLYNTELLVFDILKNEFIADVDFSDLDYTISDQGVIDSWNGLVNAGVTRTPLADNGQGFGYQNLTVPANAIDITSTDSIDSSLLSPAFQLEEILTRVLDNIVSRTDLNGWNFPVLDSNMYYFYNLKPTEAQTSPVDFTAVGHIFNTDFRIQAGGTFLTKVFKYEDPANLIQNDRVTAVHNGDYKIVLNTTLLFNPGSGDKSAIILEAWKNGVYHSDVIDYDVTDDGEITISLLVGEYVEFYLRNNDFKEFKGDVFESYPQITAIGTAGLPIAGGIIYANNYFNKTKKVDLIRDLVKMFNLVVYIDDSGILQLQTYEAWINAGSIIDLTDNILEKGYQVLSPYDVLYKEIDFLFEDAQDYSNAVYKRQNKLLYGTGELESNIPFLDKKLDNKVGFSPYLFVLLQNNKRGATALPEVTGIKNVSSPQDYDTTAYGEKYLIYWNDTQILGAGFIGYNIGAVFTKQVPYFSHYDKVLNGAIGTTTKDLNFYFTAPPAEMSISFTAGFDPFNSASLVNTYYRDYLDKLYDAEAKILKVSAALLPDEFNEIENNSIINIGGILFIILDLKYSVNNFTAKLTLLKLV